MSERNFGSGENPIPQQEARSEQSETVELLLNRHEELNHRWAELMAETKIILSASTPNVDQLEAVQKEQSDIIDHLWAIEREVLNSRQ